MKTVFVQNGIVVSHGSAFYPGVSISSNVPGAVGYDVADDSPVDIGWTCKLTEWGPEFTVPAPVAPNVSPVQFKLLFSPQERVAIKATRGNDPVIDDFFDIVEDPRLTFVDLGLQSTKDAIAYLASKSLLTEARAAEVLSGVLK